MDLSDLKPPKGAHKKRKRVGRGPGSGWGKTSGRGEKGQNARSGGRVHPKFEGGQTPLSRRLPKVGFTNIHAKTVVSVNVRDLERVFEAGDRVDEESLRAKGLVKGACDQIKILGAGELTKSLTVSVNRFSSTAREKIESAGGTAEDV
ncbi:50S ribosomal protein L15 [Bradymonas sediminis]|uniref:Large ribosomal subunit protein uL15 n=1 Tax=Bradymonas sediminis TaxID=1548548 RepID=A0A2Z4FGC1_9DELT|nr:50S ribosomal protein L15 [Bradymonas sediminis]AWV88001.1 50S ribosomal protein L15 [Bradymonas sediminis]TDP77124.1 LSU ribosomal protein L15P [Bradymonas sediminis]